ncbi:MAG: TetR-like C-terminal domain-containing protein [Gemmatimonadota bacterium]
MRKPASDPPASRATPGRPRSEPARRAVLRAARALVEKGGYAAATIDAIAARSGVAKTTIYRWWPNRPRLVVDLLVQLAAEAAPPPKGRDPLRALRTELRLGARSADTILDRLLTSLLGEAQRDPEIRTALLEGLFYPRRVASVRAIRLAQESGAIRQDVPPYVAVDLFFGPLFYRMFVRHEPLTEDFMMQVFHHVMTGIGAVPPPATRRKRAR